MRYQGRDNKAWLVAEKLPVLKLISFSTNVPEIIFSLSNMAFYYVLFYSRHMSVFDC